MPSLFLVVVVLTLLCLGLGLFFKFQRKIIASKGFAWESPAWAENAVMYEISVRHFSEAGTLAAVAEQLPRIKKLGVDIIWLMPIYPISEKNRKGSLGSPYAISNYREVHPDLGSIEEFKVLVRTAHSLGLKIILDWVPNHTGWDHGWITEHPEWYQQRNGKIIDPIEPATGVSWGWSDVAALDYTQPALRKAMISDMQFWLSECDIDGFRCDVAGPVPSSFWREARIALNKNRPIFMLSEWEDVIDHFDVAFEANYGWTLHRLLQKIAKGEKKAADLVPYLEQDRARFPSQGYHLTFTTNHDENAWIGTEKEMFGAGIEAFTAFSFCWEGMPLIFNGQEAELDTRLDFFEPNTIVWKDSLHTHFLSKLAAMHKKHPALHHGLAGGAVDIFPNSDRRVIVFQRKKDNSQVMAAFNFSAETVMAELPTLEAKANWQDALTGQKLLLPLAATIQLPPWGFVIYAA